MVAQACKVPPVKANGKPLAKPSANKGATRGLMYSFDAGTFTTGCAPS
jgi:hypothetical protein